MFEPQHTEGSPSAWWIRTCGVINLICMATYLWWRCLRSLINVKHLIWAYIFLIAECIMAIGMIVGHSSRSFPVHREKVRVGCGGVVTPAGQYFVRTSVRKERMRHAYRSIVYAKVRNKKRV